MSTPMCTLVYQRRTSGVFLCHSPISVRKSFSEHGAHVFLGKKLARVSYPAVSISLRIGVISMYRMPGLLCAF